MTSPFPDDINAEFLRMTGEIPIDDRILMEQILEQRISTAQAELDNRETDRMNAEMIVHVYGDRLVYTPEHGWLMYDGRHWVIDILQQHLKFGAQLATAFWRMSASTADDDIRNSLRARGRMLESVSGRDHAFRYAQPMLARSITEFDIDPWVLNVLNGTLNLKTGILFPHNPNDLLTRICPTVYNPDARDEIWDRILDHTFSSDAEQISYFKRFMGYCLTGNTHEKKILILKGEKDTGKTTLTEPFQYVLGNIDAQGYASTWDAEVIQIGQSNTNRNEKMSKVRGARFILVGELEQKSRMAASFVKRFTGGEAVDARAMYRGSFDYKPTAKLCMATNYTPYSSDPHLRERLVFITLKNPPKVVDRSLKVHLETSDEAHQAILAWAVEGCKEWLAQGNLGITPWLAEEHAQYARDSDPTLDFIETCCIMVSPDDPEHVEKYGKPNRAGVMCGIEPKVLYKLYTAWANENLSRQKCLKQKQFRIAMEELNFRMSLIPRNPFTVDRVTVFENLVLKPMHELPEEVQNMVRTINYTHR